MLFRKTILSMITLFMAVSGMPVYAEEAPAPEVTERKDDAAASTETESALGIKKLYAEEPETLTTGYKFNEAIKTLAAGTNENYFNEDYWIQSIQVVNTPPSEDITTKDVSANNDGSYLVWWYKGAGTIYLYSKSGDVVLNTDSDSMFYGCCSLTTLNVSNWNTSRVTKMSGMFYGCSELATLDVSKWNTSQVKYMSGMFRSCSNLTTLDVSNWDTSKVTGMNGMFYGCGNLATLDVSKWNTSKVTNMGSMFNACEKLTTLDVSGWDTGNVTTMYSMFDGCNSLSTLDLSGWNTSQVTLMYQMFQRCWKLTSLDLSGWDTSKVTDMDDMFYYCSKLAHIYIGSGWKTSSVTTSSDMFTGCTNLPHFNASIVDKTNANASPLGYMSKKPLRYLSGTAFTISGTSDYGNSVNMVVSSDKNGRMSFKNLEKGTYTLTEVSPTDGYIKNLGKYTVTVTDSGVSVVSDNPDFYYETEDQKVLFNEPYHSFTIQKTSSVDSTAGVEGAEFLLSGVSDYGTEVSQPQTTGKTGVATFSHLEAGSYLLTETKAPEHYALDPVSRIVTISKYGVVKIDGLSKEGSSFVWTDIRNADGTITITKNWKDMLTGTAAANRALPIIVISDQRTIPDAVTVTYYAGSGYFGTDPFNTTNYVTYTEKVDKDGNIVSVSVSKGQELIPSMTGKTFDAWYLDSAFTNKAPDSIANYIKANPNEKELALHARYKDLPMLTTGWKFNSMIKSLAAGTAKGDGDTDSLIQSVQVVDTPPSEAITTKDVSASNDGSYLVWWDADTKTIYLYSKYGDIVLNPDSSSMFSRYNNLTTLDVSKWDTSQVTDMNSMFYGCSSLTTLDVSKWNTGSVTNMNSMFKSCSKLTTLDVSGLDTSQVTNMGYMFQSCNKLTTLGVSNWNTEQVTNMNSMFQSCSSLTTLGVSNWNTSKVTDMSYMFRFCSSLTTLDVSGWNTSRVTNMNSMFQSCSNLTPLDVSGWNTNKVTDMSFMFSDCGSLTTLDVSKWDTSQATNMSGMFSFCTRLTTLDVSKWKTSKVTSMRYMFYYCSSLTPLDVSGWDTNLVTNMSSMFYSCSSLTTLDVFNWDTRKVTNMSSMFNSCSKLTTLDVSNWDTSKVTDMSSMFNSCTKLTTLDVSDWKTGSVTDMSRMFYECHSLTTLDVSGWDTSQVTNMGGMFRSCSNLTTIYIGSNWNTDNVTSSDYMFTSCTNLHNFNSNVVDKTNANADPDTGYMEMADRFKVPYSVHFDKNALDASGTMGG